MHPTHFTLSVLTDQTGEAVFNAINDVRGWWSAEIEGNTEKLHETFVYHYEDVHYCQLVINTLIPAKKIVWFVKYNYFKFTKDKSEWTGSTISFDIERQGDQTRLRFTHTGLVPEFECYDICSNAWSQYIGQSLLSLINNGKGQPNGTDQPRTADEERLGSSNK